VWRKGSERGGVKFHPLPRACVRVRVHRGDSRLTWDAASGCAVEYRVPVKENTAIWSKKEQEARVGETLCALSEQRRRWNLDLGSLHILPLSTSDHHRPVSTALAYAAHSKPSPSEASGACLTTHLHSLLTSLIAPRFMLLEPKARSPFDCCRHSKCTRTMGRKFRGVYHSS
jgi:hypothetical protein